jgi:diguanylate cyclase (GGDEF)-like protein
MKRFSHDLGILVPFMAIVCILAGVAVWHVQSMSQLQGLLTAHDRLLDVRTELQVARRILLESDKTTPPRTALPHVRALHDLTAGDADAQAHVAALMPVPVSSVALHHLDALQSANETATLHSVEALARIQDELWQRLWLLLVLGGMALTYAGILFLRAVRAHSRLDERLRFETSHDSLTGLPNRRFFTQWSERTMAQARRDRARLALLYIDLDGFRRVNDEQGREMGDRVLRVAAQRFRERVRESDVLARVGSDEYVVLTPVDQQDSASVIPLANRLVASLSSPLLPQFGERYPVGASIGIAIYPADGMDINALLHAAEVAMREAKAAGGNQCRFAPATTPITI